MDDRVGGATDGAHQPPGVGQRVACHHVARTPGLERRSNRLLSSLLGEHLTFRRHGRNQRAPRQGEPERLGHHRERDRGAQHVAHARPRVEAAFKCVPVRV